MLNYKETKTFIIEDIDHVFNILGVKIEHMIFVLLTLFIPAILGFRVSLSFLFIIIEIYFFRILTASEIIGRPVFYNVTVRKIINQFMFLNDIFPLKIKKNQEVYRGDF
jgi:hypothetical protein